MPYVSFTEMLQDARRGGYGIGAFNILDANSMRAVVDAAVECRSPVIVQTSVKTVRFWGHHTLVMWIKALAEPAPVPVAMHLDHCHDLEMISQCVDAGWRSVMIDASAFPLQKNMEMTKEVLDLAHACGVSVEAELGEVGGVEDDLSVDEDMARLADPQDAIRFCHTLPVDCFAPAIGTAHGIYKGKPKVAFDLLSQIADQTPIPLALHGGTGLSDEVFQRCIASGCAKVNISTQLKYAFIDGFVDYHQGHPSQYDPLKVIEAQYQELKAAVQQNIELFGSAGKA